MSDIFLGKPNRKIVEQCIYQKELDEYTFLKYADGTIVKKADTTNHILSLSDSEKANLVFADICRKVVKLDNGAFKYCNSLIKVAIPNSVKTIDYSAFLRCISLKEIMLPASVSAFGDGAFAGCISLNSIDVDPNNSYVKTENRLLLSKDGKTLIAGVGGNVIVPDGVDLMQEWAFGYFTNLTSIVIPASVTTIENWMFYSCDNLKTIDLTSNHNFSAANEATYRSNWRVPSSTIILFHQ